MAGANLLALLDDITSMLDDVALMTKASVKKTAGVIGDDLALNAQQVSGCSPNRELPVVLGVAKGSLVNKAVIVPVALLISAFAPWLVTPLLMIGGAYLCFEGAEKIMHRWMHKGEKTPASCASAPAAAPSEEEKAKIRGAIRTDFILSAEIIVIALGALPEGLPLWEKAVVLCVVGLGITLGVYGLVAVIVKLDDAGLLLMRASGGKGIGNALGGLLVNAMPYLMRILTVAGAVAMFMVGGGILAHGIPRLEAAIASLSGLFLPGVTAALLHMGVGLIAGMITLGAINLFQSFYMNKKTSKSGD